MDNDKEVGDVLLQSKLLDEELGELEELFLQLSERLNMVLGPRTEEEGRSEEVKKEAVCDLSRMLQVQQERVHSLFLSVRWLLNRLEI